MEKLCIKSNFFFSHSVFYQSGELSAIFIKFEIVVCKLFQFGNVQNLSFGKRSNKNFLLFINCLKVSIKLLSGLTLYQTTHFGLANFELKVAKISQLGPDSVENIVGERENAAYQHQVSSNQINILPNKEMLDSSKTKAFADGKMYVTQKLNFLPQGCIENSTCETAQNCVQFPYICFYHFVRFSIFHNKVQKTKG